LQADLVDEGDFDRVALRYRDLSGGKAEGQGG
jgi:hypothetical protein